MGVKPSSMGVKKTQFQFWCCFYVAWYISPHDYLFNYLFVTKQQYFILVQIQTICRWQNICYWKTEICFEKGRKHHGKRRKCWLPAFSPFPIILSKDSFFRIVKSGDCVVKSYFPVYNMQGSFAQFLSQIYEPHKVLLLAFCNHLQNCLSAINPDLLFLNIYPLQNHPMLYLFDNIWEKKRFRVFYLFKTTTTYWVTMNMLSHCRCVHFGQSYKMSPTVWYLQGSVFTNHSLERSLSYSPDFSMFWSIWM